MVIGYIADGFAKVTGKTLPVSSIRVKKFTSSTEFQSSKSTLDGFEPPYTLKDGIRLTLKVSS